MAPYVLDTAVPQPGEEVLVEDGPLLEVVRVAEPAAHLAIAVEFRGHRGGQPVLGVRTAVPAQLA